MFKVFICKIFGHSVVKCNYLIDPECSEVKYEHRCKNCGLYFGRNYANKADYLKIVYREKT